MVEEWRRLVEDVEVSSLGNVKINGQLKSFDHCRRDWYYTFSYNKQSYSVHRAVATCFIPNPEEKREVNHIDGNKHNNCVDNLEWVTRKENHDHAIRTGLLNLEPWIRSQRTCHYKPVRCIDTGQEFETLTAAGEAFGVHSSTILRKIQNPACNCPSVDNYNFEFVNKEDYTKITTGVQRRCRRVRVVETGQEFDSIQDCARYFGVDVDIVGGQCRGQYKNSRKVGLHFEYV